MASSNHKAFWQEIRKMKNSGNSTKGPLSIDDFSENLRRFILKKKFVERFVNEGMINDNMSSEESNHIHYDTSLLDSIIVLIRKIPTLKPINLEI